MSTPDVQRRPQDGLEHLALTGMAARSESDQQRFFAVHRRLLKQDLPGVLTPIRIEPTGVLRPAVLRTLRGVKLPPGLAVQVVARLAPAVRRAEVSGPLMPEDFAILPDGDVVFAPTGRQPLKLRPEHRPWVAPEAYRAPNPGSEALFALGGLLHHLLTGRDPSPPLPPSTVRGVPPDHDALVLGLTGPIPERGPALDELMQHAPPGPVDLRPAVATLMPVSANPQGVKRAVIDPGRLQLTRTEGQDVEDPGAALVVLPESLATLEPAEKHQLAGLAGLPVRTLEDLSRDGTPLVLSTHKRSRHARQARDDLPHSLPVELLAKRGPMRLLFWPVLAVLLLGAVITGVLVPIGALAWVPFLLLWALMMPRGPVLEPGLIRQHKALRRQADMGPLQPVWDKLSALRVELARADLPVTAAADLRGNLRDLEQQLIDLRQVSRTAEQALAKVDVPALRARLATLTADPSRAAERDRVARTVSDLEEVERRRDSVQIDLDALDTALDEVAAVLVRYDGGLDELSLPRQPIRSAEADAKPGLERER